MHAQKYTFAGHDKAEKIVSHTLREISQEITGQLTQEDLKALVLLGGYGKGEGGIIFKQGEYKPHNNFDLLLVTDNSCKKKDNDVSAMLEQKIEDLEARLGIGIDISVMQESRFKNMPTRVFSYDMKEGHRTLAGDKTFVPSILRNVEDIPAWDMRNLMVNRGSLLLINQLCLSLINSKYDQDNQIKKLIIKHTMKAIIGYGDAVLFFNDDYHWSYGEKQRRLLKYKDIGLKFIRLYQDAMNFRYSPKYEYYFDFNLESWQADILKTLQNIHLYCEAKRLHQSSMNWDDYLEISLSAIPTESGLTSRSIAKSAYNLFKSHPGTLPSNFCLLSRIGYYTSNSYNLTPILFPLIAFKGNDNFQRNDSDHFLMTHYCLDDCDEHELIKSYLKDWGSAFDHNLWSVLKKYNIDL